jgi:hypothetical protein
MHCACRYDLVRIVTVARSRAESLGAWTVVLSVGPSGPEGQTYSMSWKSYYHGPELKGL